LGLRLLKVHSGNGSETASGVLASLLNIGFSFFQSVKFNIKRVNIGGRVRIDHFPDLGGSFLNVGKAGIPIMVKRFSDSFKHIKTLSLKSDLF
jgi:hypothetical protein